MTALRWGGVVGGHGCVWHAFADDVLPLWAKTHPSGLRFGRCIEGTGIMDAYLARTPGEPLETMLGAVAA